MTSAGRSVSQSVVEFLTPTALTQVVQYDRRLRLLLILSAMPTGLSNESVLRRVLMAQGHAVSMDLLRTELAWLREQGLVILEQADNLYVARILPRGRDVGRGAAQQPGVASPSD